MGLDHAGKELVLHVSGHDEAAAAIERQRLGRCGVGDDIENDGRRLPESGADGSEQSRADAPPRLARSTAIVSR